MAKKTKPTKKYREIVPGVRVKPGVLTDFLIEQIVRYDAEHGLDTICTPCLRKVKSALLAMEDK